MDPLTHTLVGASLAASRLGRKTAFGASALVIGANLPDVDVFSYVAGGDAALGFRRGWTHGVLALVALPALLAVVLFVLGRWRVRGTSREEPTFGWLLGLSYLAVLTHPTLDWLNTYGMRWLMPFRDTWLYGDSVFIVDPWLWLILGVAWLLGRKPTGRLVTLVALLAIPLLLLLGTGAPAYAPLLLGVAAVLAFALFKRPDAEQGSAERFAVTGLAAATLYIAVLLALHAAAESASLEQLEREHGARPVELMVGPVPADPLTWDVVSTDAQMVRYGRFSWREGWRLGPGRLAMSDWSKPRAELQSEWSAIATSGQAPGFLGWARFPWLEIEATPNGRRAHVMDARYVRERTAGFGAAIVELPPEPAN